MILTGTCRYKLLRNVPQSGNSLTILWLILGRSLFVPEIITFHTDAGAFHERHLFHVAGGRLFSLVVQAADFAALDSGGAVFFAGAPVAGVPAIGTGTVAVLFGCRAGIGRADHIRRDSSMSAKFDHAKDIAVLFGRSRAGIGTGAPRPLEPISAALFVAGTRADRFGFRALIAIILEADS